MTLDIKTYLLPWIILEYWSHTIKQIIEEKIGVTSITWDKSCGLIGQKWKNSFQYTHTKNFLVDTKWADEQASKWISPHRQILSFFCVSYFSDVCCTLHLGQMFIIFLSIIFDFYWSVALQLSMYNGKTFRLHVSFCTSQQLVSVKIKLSSFSFS